ncbi:MAG: hypothetical protein JWM41_2292 [Gemmatimonadetes bacterium]|nr:hypothetical protein [Gemmatimonadota bacterium]
MTALRALLAGTVDYAGLFPPAGADMPAAVSNYAAYRADDNAWMLGRFVVPVARLGEFEDAHAALQTGDDPEWRLSALVGPDVEQDVARVRAFNAAHVGRASVDSLEAKLPTEDAIRRAAVATSGDAFSLFAEIPAHDDPAPLVAAIHAAGIAAKIRTGGTTADAFPPPDAVVRFIRRCIGAGVRFKATAGLHHPLRAEYPVTYDAGAPVATMYGYLNVFLAAAFMAEGMSDADAVQLLEERSANAFAVASSSIGWGDFHVTAVQLRRIRTAVAVSFGSCSFREPVDELRALGILG